MRYLEMEPSHIGGVKKLMDMCFDSSAWSESMIRSQLEKPCSYCTIAEECGDIIAYLAYEQIADEGSIIEVAVHPDYRRQGIARELINSALHNSEGLSEVFLEVRESNISARALYESLGFEKLSVRADYYDAPKENAVIMRKLYENSGN